MIPIPHDADAFLSELYGDYMHLPPESERYENPPIILDFGDGEEIRALRGDVLEAMCGLYRGGFDERRRLSNILSEKGENSDLVMFTLISFYRDIVHLVRFGKNATLQNKEYKNKLYEIGRDIGYYTSLRCIKIIDETWKNISRNAAYKLAVDNMIIKLQEVMAV